jgi:hypothetical protein
MVARNPCQQVGKDSSWWNTNLGLAQGSVNLL